MDFSSDDNNVTNEFLGALLDKYGDGPGFDPMIWLNQSFFQEFVRGDSFHKDLQHLNIMRPGEHYCSGIRDDANMVVWDIYDRIRDCTIEAISRERIDGVFTRHTSSKIYQSCSLLVHTILFFS